MEIKLVELKLENFKGIKSFEFAPGGDNATVFGDNETGKTTLADAFRWLLFSKDTNEKADFAIKTVTAQGDEIPALDHTVSAAISVDGTMIHLKKVYKEKWTKKRGEAKKQFTGHTTDYFIDGVPVQKKKWDSRLSDMIDEEAFRLVTLPSYFNSLHWQKRREILLDVCGDINDSEVVKSDPSLSELPYILGHVLMDDHRKVITAQKKTINDRLKEIPARIDELVKSLPELRNRKAIEAYINLIDKKIEKARDDTELSGLRKELADANVKLSGAKAAHTKETGEANAGTEEQIFKLKKEFTRLIYKKQEIKDDIKANQLNIERNEKNMGELRAKFAEIAAQQLPHEKICFNCNQPYPEDMIVEAEAKFNANQAKELGEINTMGKIFKTKNAALQDLIKASEKEIKEIEGDIEKAEKDIAELELQKTETNAIGAVVVGKDVVTFTDEVTRLETAIKLHKTTDISGLVAERREEMEKLAALDAAETTKKRIEELKQEEKKLAGEFEDLESQIFLMEKFIKTKVGMLESKINDKFSLAKFKLFNILVNGAVEECCETIYQGVPYSSGLNTGAQILVGCDIAKTLQDHYGVTAPMWLDHIESVNYPIEMDCQVIKLRVTKDKELKVEYN